MTTEKKGNLFERTTPSGVYTVIAKSRNNFFDGQLFVAPPITSNDRYIEVLTGDDKVDIGAILVGKEATLISFIAEDHVDEPDYRANIEEVVESLLEDLEKVSGPEEFKNTH